MTATAEHEVEMTTLHETRKTAGNCKDPLNHRKHSRRESYENEYPSAQTCSRRTLGHSLPFRDPLGGAHPRASSYTWARWGNSVKL